MIHYKKKDLFADEFTYKTLVVHVCNDVGVFNAGFAREVRVRYPGAYKTYMQNYKAGINSGSYYTIGLVTIGNMVAQNGLISSTNKQPLSYEALDFCLAQVYKYYIDNDIGEIRMPKIGSGLAGGNWFIIEKIILKHLSNCNLVIYEL